MPTVRRPLPACPAGRPGCPPPGEAKSCCLASSSLPARWAAIRETSAWAALVSMKPGAMLFTQVSRLADEGALDVGCA